MAYSMYNRGYFYDVRNLGQYGGYYGMHPMDMLEYQRGRPTKLPLRLLNRQFKKTTIQLNDQKPLVISVQVAKSKQPFLVLSNNTDDSDDSKATTDGVSIPESLAPPLIQQLRKLAKWRPTASGSLPSGQGLTFEDAVFKAQIVNLSGPDTPLEARQHCIKILAESRARDPQERKELSSVLIPLEQGSLEKLKAVLGDLVVTESPLYHTESLQGSDGSKFYLDLIREEDAHYLKISQVTRDFRSIIHVPAAEVEALRDLLETSLKAMKGQQEVSKGNSLAGNKKKRGRNPRRRLPKRAGADAKAGSQSSDGEEKENENETAAALKREPEDNSTVESRPVENGENGEKLAE